MKSNNTLYFFEGIACIFVIFIHCDISGYVGDILETIGRFAVPLFFLISGYFNYNSNCNKLTNKVLKQLNIFVVSFIIYYIYINMESFILMKNYDFISFNVSLFSLTNILKLLLFNWTSFISSHLWFLLALIFCYLFLIVVKQKKVSLNEKVFVFLPIIGYTIGIFLIKFYDESTMFLVRNWIFTGIPFFMIGYFIRKNKEIILNKITSKKLIVISAVGLLLSIIERILIKLILDGKLTLYLGTYIFVVSIFIFSIKNPKIVKKSIFSFIGEKISLYIYIIHYMFINIFKNILPKYNILINEYIISFITIFISIVIAVFLCKMIEKKKINAGV